MAVTKRHTYRVTDGSFTETKKSTKDITHAVLAEHAKESNKGKTVVLRWSGTLQSADLAVKEFSSPSWGGAWSNCRVVPVVKEA